ncbi:MAG TPA: ribosome maturation factor RimP [Acidimicrobiales bacterium]|nr:ribosome maturation factor RimP [Acidimicrobiales bacterium]
MATTTDKLHDIVATPLADLGIEVSDIELAGGLLRVTVERADGTSIDIDAIAEATRIVSRELDIHDPIPSRYTLEVSSPGLERPLRTPAHFLRAVGQQVSVRTMPGVEGERRVAGVLTSADDERIVVTSASNEGPVVRSLAYDEIERARTVFEWGPRSKGPAPKGPAPKGSAKSKEAAR